MFILGGLITVAFGVVLCARRPASARSPSRLLFGLFNLITPGAWMLVQGIELRRTGKTLQPGLPSGGKEPGLSHVQTRGTTREQESSRARHGRRETAVVWRRGDGGRRDAEPR